MPFKFREVRRSLKKKGFVENKKGHHIYFYHSIDGQRTGLYTRISHGKPSQDVGDDIVRAMRAQLGLSAISDVRGLVDCSVSAEGYIQRLRDRGLLG